MALEVMHYEGKVFALKHLCDQVIHPHVDIEYSNEHKEWGIDMDGWPNAVIRYCPYCGIELSTIEIIETIAKDSPYPLVMEQSVKINKLVQDDK